MRPQEHCQDALLDGTRVRLSTSSGLQAGVFDGEDSFLLTAGKGAEGRMMDVFVMFTIHSVEARNNTDAKTPDL